MQVFTTVAQRHLLPAADVSGNLAEVVDRCLSGLVAVKTSRPGTEVPLKEDDIAIVVKRAREVFLAQPMLLEVCTIAAVHLRLTLQGRKAAAGPVLTSVQSAVLLRVALPRSSGLSDCQTFLIGASTGTSEVERIH